MNSGVSRISPACFRARKGSAHKEGESMGGRLKFSGRCTDSLKNGHATVKSKRAFPPRAGPLLPQLTRARGV